jgi:hypothetical protein
VLLTTLAARLSALLRTALATLATLAAAALATALAAALAAGALATLAASILAALLVALVLVCHRLILSTFPAMLRDTRTTGGVPHCSGCNDRLGLAQD